VLSLRSVPMRRDATTSARLKEPGLQTDGEQEWKWNLDALLFNLGEPLVELGLEVDLLLLVKFVVPVRLRHGDDVCG
jgi:hypothetical protein